ncbi:hypothetical protein EIP91_007635 [Steccherinum ochraceum]|uniref:Uncharacterized protein n=1 Tax=Steccherinum ochraceum TaxID=92696 RepID=A0A4R0R9Q3_9APHY|nr:hypothetical protein EIP91_007635 [Steccherinum ochraceum]
MIRSTTTIISPAPVTPHPIDSKSRIRLMRSTRKLGSVLGTTPQVVEQHQTKSLPPLPFSLHPIGPRPPGKLRRPATADCTDASTMSEFSPKPIYSAPPSHSSVVSLSLTSAEEPTYKARRRPTLKSIGKRSVEVPPPLVLHLTVPTSKHHSLPQTPSTASTLTSESSPARTPLTPVFPSPTETRKKRMAKLTRTLGEKIPSQLVLATIKKPSMPSLRSCSQKGLPPPPPKSSFQAGVSRRRSMSVDFIKADMPSASPSSRVWAAGSSTWQGEWNRKDIQDVQKQLRNLRAR